MANILFLGRDQTTIHIAHYLKEQKYNITIVDTNADLCHTNQGNYQTIIIPLRGINNNYVIPSLFEDLYLNETWFQNLHEEVNIFIPYSPSIINTVINSTHITSYLNYDQKTEENNIIIACILTAIHNLPQDSVCMIGYNEITRKLMSYLDKSKLHIGINCLFDWLQVPNIGFHIANNQKLKEVINHSNIVINTTDEHSIDPNFIVTPNNVYFLDLANYPYDDNDYLNQMHLPHLNVWDICELHAPYHFGKTLGKTIGKKISN